MTFKELKAFVESMTDVELLQFVRFNSGDDEFEIDIVCKTDGVSLFVCHFDHEVIDDG